MENTYDWARVLLDSDDYNTVGTLTGNYNAEKLVPEVGTSRSVTSLQQMTDLARASGLSEDVVSSEKKDGIFRTVGKVINAIPAVGAGTANWLLNDNVRLSNSISHYYNNMDGFGALIKKELRQSGISTKDFGVKAGIFTVGTAADIFLDPTTYLTFGLSGAAKAVMKGSRLANEVARVPRLERTFDALTKTWKTVEVTKEIPYTTKAKELMDVVKQEYYPLSLSEELIKEGATRETAEKMAREIADKDVNNIFKQLASKEDMSAKMFDDLLNKGFTRGTVEDLSAMARKMTDTGGVNWMGLRLLDSKTLKNTKFGTIVRDYAESQGVTSLIEAIKTPFLTKFVYGFGRNPETLSFLEKLSAEKRILADKLMIDLGRVTEGLTSEQRAELFERGFAQKMQIVDESHQLVKDYTSVLNDVDPVLAKTLENYDSVGLKTDKLDDIIEKKVAEIIETNRKLQQDLNTKIVDIMKVTGLGNTVRTAELKDLMSGKQLTLKSVKDELKEQGVQFAKKTPQEMKEIIKHGTIDEQMDALMYGAGLMEESTFNTYSKMIAKVGQYQQLLNKLLNDNITAEEVESILNGTMKSSARKALDKKISEKSSSILDKLYTLNEDVKALSLKTTTEIENLTAKQTIFKDTIRKMADARRTVKAKFAEMGVPDFGDAKVNEVATKLWGDDGIMKKMANMIGLEDADLYKLYVPELYKPERAINSFVNGSKGWLKSKGVLTKDGLLPLEEFKNKGGIADMREALAEHSRVVADEVVKTNFFNTAIQSFGKPMNKFMKPGMSLDKAKEAAKLAGYEYVERPSIGSRAMQSGFFPKELAEEIKNGFIDKEIGSITQSGMFKTYDWFTGLFKSAVTGLFPQFHFTNWSGNVINSTTKLGLSAMDPKNNTLALNMVISSMKDYNTLDNLFGHRKTQSIKDYLSMKFLKLKDNMIERVDGTKMSAYDLFNIVKKEYPDLFHSGQFGLSELGINKTGLPNVLDKLLNPTDDKLMLTRAVKNTTRTVIDPTSKFWQTFRDLGSIVEAQSKLNVIINEWKHGATIKEAVKTAEETLFNYSKLTPFEKEVMRRIVPFYGFMRKNMEFQLKMLAEKPAHVFAQFKMLNNATISFSNAHEQNINGLPAYLDQTMGFHLGNVGSSDHKYVTGNIFPVQQALQVFGGEGSIIGNAVKSVIQSANPLIKYPIEKTTGVDLFLGRKIVEINNPDEMTSMISGMDNIIGEQFKKLIDYREVTKPVIIDGVYMGDKKIVTANPAALHLLRSLPSSRIMKTTGSILSDEKSKEEFSNLRLFTGINVYDVDDQKNIFMRRLSKYKELGQWLERIGILNDYTSFTTPMTEQQMREAGVKTPTGELVNSL